MKTPHHSYIKILLLSFLSKLICYNTVNTAEAEQCHITQTSHSHTPPSLLLKYAINLVFLYRGPFCSHPHHLQYSCMPSLPSHSHPFLPDNKNVKVLHLNTITISQ